MGTYRLSVTYSDCNKAVIIEDCLVNIELNSVPYNATTPTGFLKIVDTQSNLPEEAKFRFKEASSWIMSVINDIGNAISRRFSFKSYADPPNMKLSKKEQCTSNLNLISYLGILDLRLVNDCKFEVGNNSEKNVSTLKFSVNSRETQKEANKPVIFNFDKNSGITAAEMADMMGNYCRNGSSIMKSLKEKIITKYCEKVLKPKTIISCDQFTCPILKKQCLEGLAQGEQNKQIAAEIGLQNNDKTSAIEQSVIKINKLVNESQETEKKIGETQKILEEVKKSASVSNNKISTLKAQQNELRTKVNELMSSKAKAEEVLNAFKNNKTKTDLNQNNQMEISAKQNELKQKLTQLAQKINQINSSLKVLESEKLRLNNSLGAIQEDIAKNSKNQQESSDLLNTRNQELKLKKIELSNAQAPSPTEDNCKSLFEKYLPRNVKEKPEFSKLCTTPLTPEQKNILRNLSPPK